MTTTTYSQATVELKKRGLKCKVEDLQCSVFEDKRRIAFVFFLGLKRGFKTCVYLKRSYKMQEKEIV